MMLNTKCPKCGSHLEFPASRDDRDLLCTVCGNKFRSYESHEVVRGKLHLKLKSWKRMLTGSEV